MLSSPEVSLKLNVLKLIEHQFDVSWIETNHKESNEIDEQLNSDHVHSLTNSQHISFRFGKDTQAMRQAYRYVPAA